MTDKFNPLLSLEKKSHSPIKEEISRIDLPPLAKRYSKTKYLCSMSIRKTKASMMKQNKKTDKKIHYKVVYDRWTWGKWRFHFLHFFDLFLHHVRKRDMHGLSFSRLLSLYNTNIVPCRHSIVLMRAMRSSFLFLWQLSESISLTSTAQIAYFLMSLRTFFTWLIKISFHFPIQKISENNVEWVMWG